MSAQLIRSKDQISSLTTLYVHCFASLNEINTIQSITFTEDIVSLAHLQLFQFWSNCGNKLRLLVLEETNTR